MRFRVRESAGGPDGEGGERAGHVCAPHHRPGRSGGCARSWRGWGVGSSTTPDQHLVLTASPRALRNEAEVVHGPAWYPTARVKQLALMTIRGWRMHAVFVTPATNDGSAFAEHVVLIWTLGQHTYAAGFHKVHGVHQTL